MPIYNGWRYYPNNKGLVSGIILAGFGFGAFIFNFVSTAIVNPNNVSDVGGYFPKSVADNVPRMIKILSACWLGISIAGIIMIFPYQSAEDKERKRMMLKEGTIVSDDLIVKKKSCKTLKS